MSRERTNNKKRMDKYSFKTKQRDYKVDTLSIEKYILNFDVLDSTAEQARELVAWLQLELKVMQNN